MVKGKQTATARVPSVLSGSRGPPVLDVERHPLVAVGGVVAVVVREAAAAAPPAAGGLGLRVRRRAAGAVVPPDARSLQAHGQTVGRINQLSPLR